MFLYIIMTTWWSKRLVIITPTTNKRISSISIHLRYLGIFKSKFYS